MVSGALFANPPKTPALWRLSHPTHNVYMKTPFSKVKLYYHEGYRCMGFGTDMSLLTQTCMHLKNPLATGAEYIGMMFAVATVLPKPPQRILVLGLGGAALPRLLRRFYPNAHIDTVDIDPGVVQIARYYFKFTPSSKTTAFVTDARAFVRSRIGKTKYDLVYIDCFDDDYIPPHLLNLGFFREASKLITPKGIVAANVFMTHRLYQETLHTWKHIFPELWRLKGLTSGNTIVMGSHKPTWKTQSDLLQRATSWYHANQRTLKRHKKTLEPHVEMKKAKLVQVKGKRKLLKEAKPFQQPVTQPVRRCKDLCCGLTKAWKGYFQTERSYDATKYHLHGRIFPDNNRCMGRFRIRWKSGSKRSQAVEDFHLQFSPQQIVMDGILVKGPNYNLDNFVLSYKNGKLQGQFLQKGKRQGLLMLQPK